MKGNRVFIIYCDLGCQHIKLPVIGAGSYDRLHIVEIEFHSLRIEGCSIIELYIFTQMESIGESIIGICPVRSKAGLVLAVLVFNQRLIKVVHIICSLIGLYRRGKAHRKVCALRNSDRLRCVLVCLAITGG